VTDVFDDLIGHRSVVDLLRSELRSPSQAYLFVGPSNTGKASAARRFAAGLLCPDDPSCVRRVMRGTHPDAVLVEPQGRRAITVDQARHTVSQASLAPLEGVRKVFLFEEGGLMNDEAANALLKTLEEPTRSTIFLIVAESDDDLPETIASRCRSVVFGRVSEEEVTEGLVRLGIDRERAAEAARISGSPPSPACVASG
jgi:DNA polymerase-3 subunit delta'